MSVFERRSSSFRARVHPAHRAARARRRRFTPAIDPLEFRAMLSTLVVTNADDGGAGSLRQAIANASSGQTITFSNQLRGRTITLTGGELEIADNITIQGPDANHLAISGGGSSRVFLIDAGAHVTISGLTVMDGLASDGAGIVNQGSLTLNGCAVTGNQANEDAGSPVGAPGNAGGLENLCGATMTIIGSTISGNQSVGDPTFGGPAQGGGIANFGVLNINGSMVTNNQALAATEPGSAARPPAVGSTRATRNKATPRP